MTEPHAIFSSGADAAIVTVFIDKYLVLVIRGRKGFDGGWEV